MRNSHLKHFQDRSQFKTTDEISSILAGLHHAVVGVRRDHTIVFFSHNAASIFGFSKQEIVGRPVDLLLPKSDLFWYRVPVADSARSASQPLVTHQRREVSGRRRDGTIFPVKVCLANGCWRGEPVTFAIVRDASDQPKYPAALRASGCRYRMITETAPEPILITGESGLIERRIDRAPTSQTS